MKLVDDKIQNYLNENTQNQRHGDRRERRVVLAAKYGGVRYNYVGLRHIAHGWCNQISSNGATTIYDRDGSNLSLKTKYLFCSQLIA